MRPTNRRGRLWIDPPFQGRLLLRVGLYLVAYAVLAWHAGFALEVMSQVAAGGATRALDALYADYFRRQLPLLCGLALLVPPLLYDMLRFSHRVAGPLRRCRTLMGQMAAGEAVREFQPRRGDLMVELFASFNGLIRAHNARAAAGGDPAGAAEAAARNGGG
jgi:hypothetical protein